MLRLDTTSASHWASKKGNGREGEACCGVRGFIIRRLNSLNDDLRQLIDPPPSLPCAWTYGGHWSWGSARPDVLNPVVGMFYRDTDTGAWGLWDGEVVAVRTDVKASAVWRSAHHRSVFDDKDFWDGPRGNVSPDGRLFIFTSIRGTTFSWWR